MCKCINFMSVLLVRCQIANLKWMWLRSVGFVLLSVLQVWCPASILLIAAVKSLHLMRVNQWDSWHFSQGCKRTSSSVDAMHICMI